MQNIYVLFLVEKFLMRRGSLPGSVLADYAAMGIVVFFFVGDGEL